MWTGCVGAAATGASRPPARQPEKMTALSDRLFRPLIAALVLFAGGVGARRSASTTSARARAAWRRGPTRRRDRNMPTQLRELDYDAYRDIRYRPEKALWRAEKLPFELMFFHQGRAVSGAGADQRHRAGRRARRSQFDPALFDYGKNKFEPQSLSGLGFNGFRVHYADQQAGLQGRGPRLPGRELLPRRRQGAVVRPVGARPGGRHRGRRAARSSRASSSSGSSGRAPAPPR